MSKAEFQLAFDGPALKDGTMDVNELATSLLAVGDLVREANQDLNMDKAEATLLVRSDFKKGSFEVALLIDQSLIEHAKGMLFPAAGVLGGGTLVTLLFGTDAVKKGGLGVIQSVTDIWKKCKGEKPKSVIEDKDKGISILVFGDGNQVSVDTRAGRLYDKEPIRTAIAGMVRPLAKPGVKSLEVRKGRKTINAIEKADLPPDPVVAADGIDVTNGNVRKDSRDTVVRVTRVNFDKGKWGFSDGAATFAAEITDETFKQQLDSGEEGFYKGDTLRVILTVKQTVGNDGLVTKTVYEIEKVLKHTHLPRQQPLLPDRRNTEI